MARSTEAAGRWSFLFPFLAFVVVCGAAMALTLRFAAVPVTILYWGILAYFGLLTFALHAWQERVHGTDPKAFVRRFMAGLVIKMMLSLVVLLVLLVTLSREHLIPVAITFVLIYLAFLAFSTSRSVGLMRQRPNA